MRPRSSLFLALLSLALLPAPTLACTCAYGGPFSKVAPKTDLVIVGDVVSHHENSMQVEVVQVLKGDETRKRLTVWGDNGMQCRPYVTRFPEKTRWVLAVFRHEAQEDLDNLQKPLYEWDAKPPFYMISVCGGYWLEVKGEEAHGHVQREGGSETLETIPVRELERWFDS